MTQVLAALAPIFACIALGWALRRTDFPGPGFWPVSERLTYYVLFPALLVSGLLRDHVGGGEALALAGCLLAAVSITAGLLLALRPWLAPRLRLDGPGFTSVFQGAIRPNTYVGLSAAVALMGEPGLALSAVALLTLIPLVNVLCVGVLARHATGGGPARMALEVVRNPLILACAGGLGLNAAGLTLPAVLLDSLAVLGRASLPMGLLAVGAGLDFASAWQGRRAVLAASGFKLALLPLVALAAAWAAGLGPNARLTAVIYTAIPVSVSSFILARQMGGDHRLMAAVITGQTVIAALTLPLLLALAQLPHAP